MRPALAMGAILGTLLLAACSAHTKHEWLSFFFDGVPPEKTESPASAAPPAGAGEPKTGVPAAWAAARAAPEKTVHRPYGDRSCDACHESKFSQKLRGTTGEICLLCHKNLFAGAEFRHAPAEGGDCLVCHDPHQSAERFLLTRRGQKVCLDCHERKDAGSHAGIGETACQDCHNPHGGVDGLFLKTGAPRSPAESSTPTVR